MADLVSCRKCGVEVKDTVYKCPECGVEYPGFSYIQRLIANVIAYGIIGIIMLFFIVVAFSMCSDSSNSDEDKEKGFHCLSNWDGAHSNFKSDVKNLLREPKSFEHIETRVSPRDENGQHNITMKYRARNGFGGMNIGNATGIYRNSDCIHFIYTIE